MGCICKIDNEPTMRRNCDERMQFEMESSRHARQLRIVIELPPTTLLDTISIANLGSHKFIAITIRFVNDVNLILLPKQAIFGLLKSSRYGAGGDAVFLPVAWFSGYFSICAEIHFIHTCQICTVNLCTFCTINGSLAGLFRDSL